MPGPVCRGIRTRKETIAAAQSMRWYIGSDEVARLCSSYSSLDVWYSSTSPVHHLENHPWPCAAALLSLPKTRTVLYELLLNGEPSSCATGASMAHWPRTQC